MTNTISLNYFDVILLFMPFSRFEMLGSKFSITSQSHRARNYWTFTKRQIPFSESETRLEPDKATANSPAALIYTSSIPTPTIALYLPLPPLPQTLFSWSLDKGGRQGVWSGRTISHKFLEDSSMRESRIKMTVITFPPQISYR